MFTLPQNMATGSYYFIVAADRPVAPPNDFDNKYVNFLYDSPEKSNHEMAAPSLTAVTVGPTPELAVSKVMVPATASSGQTLTLSWTVTNNGSNTGNVPITDSVYLSYDQVFESSDLYLASANFMGGLAGGASYTQTATLTLPPGVAGPFYVFVQTNSNGNVFEHNLAAAVLAPQSVNLVLPPTADLVAGTVVTPSTSEAGLDLTLTYQVTNNGSHPADGSWYDTLYLSPTPTWNVNDPLLGSVYQTQNLAPGASYTGTLTAPLPGVAPGSYYVIVRL